MSSFAKKAKNPETGKMQVALFLDNYYGSHSYGVAFRRDGEDADITKAINIREFKVYKENKIIKKWTKKK